MFKNGTGEQITDKTGKSLKPWVIKENNHYYKPYEDYITHEDDYGLKLYAYYIIKENPLKIMLYFELLDFFIFFVYTINSYTFLY